MRAMARAIWLAAACGSARPAAKQVDPWDHAPASSSARAAAAVPADAGADAWQPQFLTDIDWKTVQVTSDADARALWLRIAPTEGDTDKLVAIPKPIAHELAIALLREGNFRCPPVGPTCPGVPEDVPTPAEGAGFDEPCFRRELASWAIDQLNTSDFHALTDALLALLDVPTPDEGFVGQLLDGVSALPVSEQLPYFIHAWRAGHRGALGDRLAALPPDELKELYKTGHVDMVLETLPASLNRDVFLAAINDDKLQTKTRLAVIDELLDGVDTLPDDVHRALATATKSTDCEVAGAASVALVRHKDRAYVPKWPGTTKVNVMMRSLCVLAAFEHVQTGAEPSYLPGYIAPKGYALTHNIYDPYVDPPDRRAVDHIAPAQAVLPELEQLIVAMHHCVGAVCKSDTHEFRFGFSRSSGGLLVSSIEVVDLPPCMAR